VSESCAHDPGWIPRNDYVLDHPKYQWGCARCGVTLAVEPNTVLPSMPVQDIREGETLSYVSVSWEET
jgi:hypothetical protein